MSRYKLLACMAVFSCICGTALGSDGDQLRVKAIQGDVRAQNELGVMYVVPQDDQAAIKWFVKYANIGNSEAQYNLGVMYKNGIGMPQSDVDALDWFTKASEKGNASAQSLLAAMYEKGQGTSKDLVQAYKWYTLSETGLSKELANLIIKDKEAVALKMTPEQINEANSQVRIWKEQHPVKKNKW